MQQPTQSVRNQIQVFQTLIFWIHLTHQITSTIKEEDVQKKLRSKTHLHDPIKKCANLKAKVLTASYKSKVIKLKLGEYLLH